MGRSFDWGTQIGAEQTFKVSGNPKGLDKGFAGWDISTTKSEIFQVTGSDSSSAFVERYRKIDPAADLMLLDAITMDTDGRFDCVYSNKVLQHLTREELQQSLGGQLRVLKRDGILFHTLWVGDKEEEFSGLRFVYYTEDTFRELVGDAYEIVELERYAEMEQDDSFYVVLRRAV